MPLAQPSISQICKSLAVYLTGQFSGGDTSVRVLLGSPADAVPAESESDHRLNLFFFKFEPSGFNANTLPGETHFLRLHCLATPFGVSEQTISSGENDLRIIGELIRIFQENPVFELAAGGDFFHIQVIFLTLGTDQLNQLWATQGDTVYRPSVLLEVSLAPVIPDETRVEGPLTGAAGLEVRANMNPQSIGASASMPIPVPMAPDTRVEHWAPALGLVHNNVLSQSLSFALGSPDLATFTPQAWMAGEIGAGVNLVWELWNSTDGWHAGGTMTPALISVARLDPDVASSATTTALTLPFNDQAGQMVLYAERTYKRAADSHTLTVRSNPVLINLFAAAP